MTFVIHWNQPDPQGQKLAKKLPSSRDDRYSHHYNSESGPFPEVRSHRYWNKVCFFLGGRSQDGKVCVIPKDFGGSLEGYDEWQLAAMFFPFRGLIFQMSASQCEKRGIDDG